MSKVYQKMGIFGRTYWHDSGLFVKQISKQQYEQLVIDSKVSREVARQLEKQNKKQGK